MTTRAKQLPDWFNIKNYDQLMDTVAYRFILQIFIRTCILESLNKYPNIKGMPDEQKYVLFGWESYVKQGKPILEPNDFDHLERKNEKVKKFLCTFNTLDSSRAVKPISFMTLSGYDLLARRINAYSHSCENENGIGYFNPKNYHSSVSLENKILGNGNGAVLSEIILENNTDEVILKNLEKQLKLWRKKLNIPEPISRTGLDKSYFASLVNYNIIPLLDLMIFERISNALLPQKTISFTSPKLLSQTLLTEKTETQIKHIKGTVENCMAPEWSDNCWFALEAKGLSDYKMVDLVQ